MQEVDFIFFTSSIEKKKHDQLKFTHCPHGRHFEKESQVELTVISPCKKLISFSFTRHLKREA
jgi:hypothetical protein